MTATATQQIPTWDQAAYIVRTSPEHFDEDAGCHHQGATIPAEYLVIGEGVDDPETWVTSYRIEDATRFPTWGEAIEASDRWDEAQEEPEFPACPLEFEPRFRNAAGGPAVFVNLYRVGYCHGGPEEGGWGFWAGEPIASVAVADRDVAEAQQDALVECFCEDDRHGNRQYEVRIEGHPGEEFPREHPHYC